MRDVRANRLYSRRSASTGATEGPAPIRSADAADDTDAATNDAIDA
jgi:hypothetical protein